MVIVTLILGVLSIGAVIFFWLNRKRRLDRWLGPYICQSWKRRRPGPEEEVHVLLCIADHFEPKSYDASPEVAWERVHHWVREYPRQFAGLKDSDGRPPQYSFFFPIEEYEPEYLDALGDLCRQGFGEVEVHLHHDRDTAEGFRTRLLAFTELLAERHGLLSRHRETGELAYAFIHGNWALCNSRPDGRDCGVNNELDILRETGCFADLTFPSAPSPTQPARVNQIYYASNRPGPRSHDHGLAIGSGPAPERSLLLIQGPLLLDWSRPKWGILPRIENGCLQPSQPPSMKRLDAWLRARIQVPNRPDWFFVKLHAHGAPQESHEVLLGGPMVKFHRDLARRARENPNFHYHYVTAREMYNLIKAAEDGFDGPVKDALDYLVVSNVSRVMEVTG